MGECILAGHPQGGKIGYGTYTGDGAASRTISLGVTPKWVLVVDSSGQPFRSGYFSNGTINSRHYGGLAIAGFPAAAISIVNGGFSVAYADDPYYSDDILSNSSGMVFKYIYGT